MTYLTKIYIAAGAAGILILLTVLSVVWSNHRVAKLERSIETATQTAAKSEQLAEERRREAEAFREKITYLEQQLNEIAQTARKQDEIIEKRRNDSSAARRDVGRARSTRTIETGPDTLCTRLAALGHPC